MGGSRLPFGDSEHEALQIHGNPGPLTAVEFLRLGKRPHGGAAGRGSPPFAPRLAAGSLARGAYGRAGSGWYGKASPTGPLRLSVPQQIQVVAGDQAADDGLCRQVGQRRVPGTNEALMAGIVAATSTLTSHRIARQGA